jgi:hypothetical protein
VKNCHLHPNRRQRYYPVDVPYLQGIAAVRDTTGYWGVAGSKAATARFYIVAGNDSPSPPFTLQKPEETPFAAEGDSVAASLYSLDMTESKPGTGH